MKKSIKTKIYNDFHRKTGIQTRIIGKDNFTYRILIKVIAKFVKQRMNVLDIGCGAGTLSLFLASKGISVRGIDYSRDAILKCKKSAHLLNLKDVHFDRMHFPKYIPKEKYDLIMCLEVLEHIEDDDLALKKIYRLLNKDGVVIISVPSKNAPLHRLGYAKRFDERVGHLRRYNVDELLSLINEEKLKVVEVTRTEGLLRNFLFLNTHANKLVIFIRLYIADLVTLIDDMLVKLLGESQIIVVAQKI